MPDGLPLVRVCEAERVSDLVRRGCLEVVALPTVQKRIVIMAVCMVALPAEQKRARVSVVVMVAEQKIVVVMVALPAEQKIARVRVVVMVALTAKRR